MPSLTTSSRTERKMLLNVSPEELVALKAAMEIALKAASGYSVRTCPERDIIGAHWMDFTRLHSRIKALEAQREFHMTKGQIREGRKYIHVAIDDKVHDKLYAHVLKLGGGKIVQGALGAFVEEALLGYLDYLDQVTDQAQQFQDQGDTQRVHGALPPDPSYIGMTAEELGQQLQDQGEDLVERPLDKSDWAAA
jgi:hypothetical protein